MFVVAGVTGHTGSIVAETLLGRKQRVRVIVRTPEKGAVWQAKGAEAAVVSLDDADALAKALEGAAGAYVLIPPNYHVSPYIEHQKKIADALAHAVGASRLPHVVFLSSIGAHLPTGTGPIQTLHYGEHKLGEAARSMTVLRAPYFMENWQPVLGAARAQGILPSFLSPTRKIPMIATRDIGRIAAECLLDRADGRKILELSGPEDYSPQDVAAAVGRRLHRDVEVQLLPLSAVVPTFTSIGFSEEAARLLEDMYAGINNSYIVLEGGGTAQPRGLITLSEALSEWI